MSTTLRGRRQPSQAQQSGLMRREARSLLGGGHARGGNTSSGTFLMGTVGNVMIRLLGVSLAFDHLAGGASRAGGARPSPFVFLALAAASVPLVLAQFPFPLKLRRVSWGHVVSKGALRFASLTLWCHALSRAGPARSLLCEQCGALLLPALLTNLLRRPSRCVVACAILLAALVLLQEGHLHPGAIDTSGKGVGAAGGGNAAAAAAAAVGGDLLGYPAALAALMGGGGGAASSGGGRWAALEAMAAGGGPEGVVHLGIGATAVPFVAGMLAALAAATQGGGGSDRVASSAAPGRAARGAAEQRLEQAFATSFAAMVAAAVSLIGGRGGAGGNIVLAGIGAGAVAGGATGVLDLAKGTLAVAGMAATVWLDAGAGVGPAPTQPPRSTGGGGGGGGSSSGGGGFSSRGGGGGGGGGIRGLLYGGGGNRWLPPSVLLLLVAFGIAGVDHVTNHVLRDAGGTGRALDRMDRSVVGVGWGGGGGGGGGLGGGNASAALGINGSAPSPAGLARSAAAAAAAAGGGVNGVRSGGWVAAAEAGTGPGAGDVPAAPVLAGATLMVAAAMLLTNPGASRFGGAGPAVKGKNDDRGGRVFRRRARPGASGYLDLIVGCLPQPLAAGVESIRRWVSAAKRYLAGAEKQRRLLAFLTVNTAFMLVEFACGAANNSIGLLTDACHMLFDNASVAVAMYAVAMARRPRNRTFNYGFARFEVLAGFANGVFLVFVSLLIVLESIERIMEPQEMSTENLMLVSVLGLAVNIAGLVACQEAHSHAHSGAGDCAMSGHAHGGGGACTDDHGNQEEVLSPACTHVAVVTDDGHVILVDLESGEHVHDLAGYPGHTVAFSDDGAEVLSRSPGWPESGEEAAWDVVTGALLRGAPPPPLGSAAAALADHNMSAMFLHILADTLGSVGVIISTALVQWRGWVWTDPAAAVFIAVLILLSTVPLLQQAAELLTQRLPAQHVPVVRAAVEKVRLTQGVAGVARAQFWCHTPKELVGSVVVVATPEADRTSVMRGVRAVMADAGVVHASVQVEEDRGGGGGGGVSSFGGGLPYGGGESGAQLAYRC